MSAGKTPVPHPSIVAAREALAKRPPASIESVIGQIQGVNAWRDQQSEIGKASSPQRASCLPHPGDIAARAALAKQTPASFENVMIQARASGAQRKRQSDGETQS